MALPASFLVSAVFLPAFPEILDTDTGTCSFFTAVRFCFVLMLLVLATFVSTTIATGFKSLFTIELGFLRFIIYFSYLWMRLYKVNSLASRISQWRISRSCGMTSVTWSTKLPTRVYVTLGLCRFEVKARLWALFRSRSEMCTASLHHDSWPGLRWHTHVLWDHVDTDCKIHERPIVCLRPMSRSSSWY